MFNQARGGCHSHNMGMGPRGGSRRWGPFEVRWEVSDDGRGPRGRGRGRMFDGGELRLVLLKLIADQPRHGYDLIREIEELTGGAYAPSPGVVYPTLTLLDDMGLIGEQQSEGAKKQFAVTPAGAMHIEENREQVEVLMARLTDLGAERQRTDRAPIRRAMRNLRVALQNRMEAADLSDDAAHQVAALLDEVAQKIERLG